MYATDCFSQQFKISCYKAKCDIKNKTTVLLNIVFDYSQKVVVLSYWKVNKITIFQNEIPLT